MQSENVLYYLNKLHNVVFIAMLDNKVKCIYSDGQEFNVYLDDSYMIEALFLCDQYDITLEYVVAVRDALLLDASQELGLLLIFYRSNQDKLMLDELIGCAKNMQLAHEESLFVLEHQRLINAAKQLS
jgi:hypothetical protein